MKEHFGSCHRGDVKSKIRATEDEDMTVKSVDAHLS